MSTNRDQLSSSSSSGLGDGDDDSLGFCFPCLKPSEDSGPDGDCRGLFGPTLWGGANFAEGEGRDEGDSSVSSRCRGEISECGVELDFGEGDGFGATVSLGAAVTLGAAEDFGFGEIDGGVGDEVVVVLFFKFQLKAELFANAVSMLATVITSPPLKVPRLLFAGKVAVGGWPTGIGS